MRRGPFLLAALLAAASAGLLRELVTRPGVGPIEYVVGSVVLAALLLATAVEWRRGLRRA
jgi:uncharacterized membrane protein